ncbi:MAG: hypothetical protein AAGC82_17485 [Pseudomonadota bacterium]
MPMNLIFAACTAILALSTAVQAGPAATGNAAGGAIVIVTPIPLISTEPSAAPAPVPPPQTATTTAAPVAPATTGFIAGYVATFR